ncbi:MAG: DNA polymerase III subunit epsilon, partial [Lachnospiraceae bacterium]|nr:DNA polymerase III subunit epsilon [Lachnospiraceae bacterium]
MLSRKPGKKLNTYVSDYVVFDLETTGVSCNSDDVVEISAIKVIDGEVVDEFTTLVNPGRTIPYHSSEVNGIT